MKNVEREETPVLQLDRDPVLLVFFVLLTCVFIYFTYTLFVNFSPWGFLLMVPTGFVSFQTLWFILNPFALLFEDKLEVKQSLFQNKRFYFIDIKKLSESKKGKLYITYTDDEMKPLSLFGINKNHVSKLKEEISKKILQP